MRCFACGAESEVRLNAKGKYYYICPGNPGEDPCLLVQATGKGFSKSVEAATTFFTAEPAPISEPEPAPGPEPDPIPEPAPEPDPIPEPKQPQEEVDDLDAFFS